VPKYMMALKLLTGAIPVTFYWL